MSNIASEIKAEMEEVARVNDAGNGNGELRDVVIESALPLKGRKRASWMTQFRILSERAFKNFYRDPTLLAAHYLSSIALACEYLVLDLHDLDCCQRLLLIFNSDMRDLLP